ncbi:complex I subunit 4 family protein [Helicobacter bilis]|uniref:NADH-quinone oxidoreductase subunit M n=1 Tax=Helicobacter bilis TaxID=37372 RepID=A0A4U8UA81_9HELI|nr:NADH-quinone oxidoreductase subunit M [Helicobacter bilis]MCI7412001.1 NADH-quinone oxidoreductase subunit M [Helicobacter bilis]MDD7296006.1 NADH-quinone oxidoreductase subunit M [Helicobacter bilis]MDY4399005.1 NADH-quinone oxidoreductase subunit M [Helicobacter bilis]TLE08472.1 NADH-quinone oxidoreductase subunit M [Helicobacter bilis]TLE10504.1 NADH-quinone oxidoreductase subunit M [Helicobacter bilis]
MEYLLSLIIGCPLVACLFIFMFDDSGAKRFGRIISFIELGLVIALWISYRVDIADTQFFTKIFLIPALGIDYIVFVDGISLFLIVLTAFIIFLANIYLQRRDDAKPFVVCLLSLEAILMALFVSQNVLMFYTCWELALLPVLYMVGVWGSGQKIYIGLKFFVYTFASSLMMLLAILYIGYLCYEQLGYWSFDLGVWLSGDLKIPLDTQIWLFLGFFVSIAVKIPIIPLHTWLPHIYSEAPALGSVMLSALLSKMGTYALLRFVLPLFPDASVHFMPIVSVLAVIMVVYAGIIAFKQKDIKKVIAYSSISHMGIVVLGIFAFNNEGISGAIFMMVAHGVTSGGLFMLAGMLYYRTMTRHVDDFGGVAHVMPHYSTFFAIVMLSNVGLPLTIGFVGEFLSLYGYFQTSPIITAIAGTTLIIAASYMLYLFKNVFYGTLKQTHITQSLKDLGFKEFCVLGPIAFVIIWLGVFPNTLLKPMQVSVQQLVGTTYTLAQEQTTKEHIAKVNNSLVIERAMLNNTIMDNLGELPPPTPQRESMDSNTESQSIDNQSNSTNKEE